MARKPKAEAYDKTHKIVNLHLIITIINRGLAYPVVYLIEKHGVSGQFIQRAEGTAKKDVLDMLGMENNAKDVIYSMVPDNKYEEVLKDLDNFLTEDRKTKGIAFSIPFDTIAGRTAYHFLTNTFE